MLQYFLIRLEWELIKEFQDQERQIQSMKILWLSLTNLGLNYQTIHLDNQKLKLKVVNHYG